MHRRSNQEQPHDKLQAPPDVQIPDRMKFEPTNMDQSDPEQNREDTGQLSGAFIDVAGTGDAGDYRNPAPGTWPLSYVWTTL